jgi:tRNA-dihydrouridine synthase B
MTKVYIKPIKIGNIEIDTPVILAPMSGVTDMPFRKLATEYGAGLVISEMIASRAMILQTRQSMQQCQIDITDHKNSTVQLAGCDPDIVAEAAKLNEDMGAKIIDLNFGCPAKKVTGGFAGSALMKDLSLAAKILESTVKAVSVPVTLKTRLGWDKDSKNVVELAKIAQDVGIKMLTVHGRTRSQFFSETADWEYIKNVRDAIKIPLIVNGDIKSLDCAKKALELSGADGVMIGRACYGKPWLLGQIAAGLQGKDVKEISLHEQYQVILRHYREIIELYKETNGVPIARKHICWYSKNLPSSNDFRNTVNRLHSAKEVEDKIHEYFDSVISESV